MCGNARAGLLFRLDGRSGDVVGNGFGGESKNEFAGLAAEDGKDLENGGHDCGQPEKGIKKGPPIIVLGPQDREIK